MGDWYMSEIRLFAFDFAPRGWMLCNGQLLAVQQNEALFSLLGVTYGGDGARTFALPNLQGRVPLHFGAGIVLGGFAGEETHTLSANEMPTHSHAPQGDATAGSGSSKAVTGALLGTLAAGTNYYGPLTHPAPMSPKMVTMMGGNTSHTNMQPYVVVNACIAISGLYPSRS